MISVSPCVALVLVIASATSLISSAFVAPINQCFAPSTHDRLRRTPLFMATVVKPPETETDRRTKKDDVAIPQGEGEVRGPVEWLIDDRNVSREFDEPFHILLLDQTFVQSSRITIEYVASSCSYVLGMPYDEAAELAAHAEKEGFSCLGTWSNEECVRLAGQLQNRDLVCRVVPFCEGGDRAWQARNAMDDADMKGAEDDSRWG
mmetsp:Transcript_24621/g.53083  ORF Transcript_24621/g.53083 Transcript_24621/m.53083 type:complete len:205 (+) Transcript_24621:110-724(+)